MKSALHRVGQTLGAIALAMCAGGALAQDAYPNHPIRIIVPWPAGGSVDVATRVITNELSARLGQPVVVENRPGASGNIGAAAAAKATPDGYTLLVATTPMIVNRSLYSSLPFDLEKDFVPVSMLVNVSYVLVANPSVASSVQDLIAKAKARPGQMSYASSGPGTPLHLLGEAFKKQAGVDIVHTPYKGAPPALTDLMGGHVQMMFPGLPVVEPLIKSGRVKALAVASKHRQALLPDVPTLAEAGVPGIEDTDWYGLVAPRGTPANVVARLNEEIVKLMKAPGVRQSLASRGFEPTGSSPQEFAALIEAEARRWPVVVRQAGLKPE